MCIRDRERFHQRVESDAGDGGCVVDVLEGVVVDFGVRRLGDVVDGGVRSLGEVVDAVVVLVFVAIVGVLEC